MNRVTTINLAGAAYQLEEPGYEALSRYLEEARAALDGNPDQQEILQDIESAIGQKCAARLSAHKNVLNLVDIEEILKEMGPVGSADTDSHEGSKAQGEPHAHAAGTRKKLYQIREGAWILGVCNGLAAYLNWDVIFVRVLFVIFTLITHGVGIAVYVVMALIVPIALTERERAQAHGVPPVTAQMLLKRAKDGYEHVKNSGEWHKWRAKMSAQERQWRHQQKREQRLREWQAKQMPPFWQFMHSVLGLVWFLVILGLGYWSYEHIPPFHTFINNIPHYWQQAVDWLSTKIAENNN